MLFRKQKPEITEASSSSGSQQDESSISAENVFELSNFLCIVVAATAILIIIA